MQRYVAAPAVFREPSCRFTRPLLALRYGRRLSQRYGVPYGVWECHCPRLTPLRAFRPSKKAA